MLNGEPSSPDSIKASVGSKCGRRERGLGDLMDGISIVSCPYKCPNGCLEIQSGPLSSQEY